LIMNAVSAILVMVIAATAVPTNALVPDADDSPTGSSRLTPQGDPDRYIVVYRNNVGAVQATVAAGQVHVDLPELNAVAATIPPEEVASLRDNPNIESIEQDLPRFSAGSFRGSSPKTNNADTNTKTTATTTRRLTGTQQTTYGIPLVQADQVPMGNSFVPKICIIDSGYDLAHVDLPGEPQVTGDSDIGGAGEWFQDGSSHGTHVAGTAQIFVPVVHHDEMFVCFLLITHTIFSLYSISTGTIAAVDNDKGVVGVCPGCNLHIVRVFGQSGAWAYSSTLLAAAMKCKAAGANIISMSLGGSGFSSSENTAFTTLLTVDNILIVAAAGNDGNTALSYPASYDSVLSVAALDDKRIVASFSQKNAQVDISAPGVSTISTVPMATGLAASVITASGATYAANNFAGSVAGVPQAALVDCFQGATVCTGVSGSICLIQRGGGITFGTKVQNCHNGGGIGAIIYNNVPGIFTGTLGTGWTIITTAVAVADTTGTALLALVGTTVTVPVGPSDYGTKSGTSMATPHVSGVAGLVWSHDATKSAQDIRNALTSTALDLGPVGRDDSYGFGNVHACDAAKALGATGLSCFEPSSCVGDADCNDGNFCNGVETCDVGGTGFCKAGTTACSPTEACDEDTDTCILPPPAPGCVVHSDCFDGVFCNGDELCGANGVCQPSRTANPCDATSQTCNEDRDTCVDNVVSPPSPPPPPQCSDLGASCQDAADCCSGRCLDFFGSQFCK
jgi:serine protease